MMTSVQVETYSTQSGLLCNVKWIYLLNQHYQIR